MIYKKRCTYSRTLKSQKPRALEGEFPLVAFHQQSVLISGKLELHTVAAFHLEGGVVGGGGVILPGGAAGVVVGHVGSLGNHRRRDGQPGRIVVCVPLAEAFDRRCDDHGGYRHKHDCKQNAKEVKTHCKTHISHPFPMISAFTIPCPAEFVKLRFSVNPTTIA